MSQQSNPRAFVTATGFIFQAAGLVLAFGGCCMWSFAGKLQTQTDQPIEQWADYWQPSNLPASVAMIDVAFTFISGLGLMAVGVGLQGERPGSGRWALVLTAGLFLIWALSLATFLLTSAGWTSVLVALLFVAGSFVLFLLAGYSQTILRLHPPPQDYNVVDEAFLEQYRRRPPE